jgi:hypothetical protein
MVIGRLLAARRAVVRASAETPATCGKRLRASDVPWAAGGVGTACLMSQEFGAGRQESG